jgi:hypothetical protein
MAYSNESYLKLIVKNIQYTGAISGFIPGTPGEGNIYGKEEIE